MFLSTITPTGKPPPLAVRLEQALPFRRCVRGEDVLWGSPASQTIQKPQAQYHGEARSSGVVPRRVPSLNEECALMHPLQGASFLSTPLQGGILKPPALRVVGDYDCLVLFPVNPLTVAKYREAFTPSRAKDDPTDAELQVEILLKHRDKLTPLSPQSPTMRALAQLVEHRRRLVGDKVRLTNRLTSALKNYFPHVLQWFQEKDTGIFCDFLSHWPTLKAAQLARRTTLERFFQAHHVRAADVITTRIEAIKSAVALTTDEGVIAPNTLLVQALVAQLRVTLHAIADFDTAIAQRAQDHPDFPLFDALPGAGAVFAPRLLVAFGEQRERYTSAEELQKYAGIAPVTERS